MRTIIVREYLESLTENEELDIIFPILLEVMGFRILSTPKLTKGLPQYGKDVVAIGIDEIDQTKKRFYFEIKGGANKDITTSNFKSDDGIVESIYEAKNRPFNDSSIPKFENLPVKIVLVHNGELKANIKETFDGFIQREFPKSFKESKESIFKKLRFKRKLKPTNLEFERWDIFKLTSLFNEFLFGEYLLSNEEDISQFKKVLVLLNNPQNQFSDLFNLIERLIKNLDKEKDSASFNRKQKLLFESLNLVAFIIYSHSKYSNNLEPAKRAVPFIILRLWSWIIENNKESVNIYLEHFKKIFNVYLIILEEYFKKLIPIALLKNGVFSEQGGRYEQIGYPLRSLDFMEYLIFYFSCIDHGFIEIPDFLKDKNCDEILVQIINNNSTKRPLLDNHSIPIFLILTRLMNINPELAKEYLNELVENIIIGYKVAKRLPDGGNNIETVIRFILTGKKSIYYIDSTSLLIGMLFEFLGILKMENEYKKFRDFISDIKIDIGVFVPFKDDNINEFLPEISDTLETRLFKKTINNEGYQSEILLDQEFNLFTNKTKAKSEFDYKYKTDTCDLYPLRILAHIFYKTPFFPNEWREKFK